MQLAAVHCILLEGASAKRHWWPSGKIPCLAPLVLYLQEGMHQFLLKLKLTFSSINEKIYIFKGLITQPLIVKMDAIVYQMIKLKWLKDSVSNTCSGSAYFMGICTPEE